MRRQHQDQQSKVFHELSALVLDILQSPPALIPFSDESPTPMTTTRLATTLASRQSSTEVVVVQITLTGSASLMLGISLALMLYGLVTFFIGFLLMPQVLGLKVDVAFSNEGMILVLDMRLCEKEKKKKKKEDEEDQTRPSVKGKRK